MPIIDGVKFSCSPCIRGHRSAHCPDNHSDRPLVEVKKKGRPVSQCVTCRHARKTKALHGKCNCELKPEHNLSSELAQELAAIIDPARPLTLRNLVAKPLSGSVGTDSPARSRAASIISSSSQMDEKLKATAGRKLGVTGNKRRESTGLHELAHGHSATNKVSSRTHFDPYASPYMRPASFDPHASHQHSAASSCHSRDDPPQPSSSSIPSLRLSALNLDTSLSLLSSPPVQVERSYGSSFFLPLTNAQNESKLCYCGPNCTCAGCHVHDPAGLHLHDPSGVRCGVSCQSFGLCSGDMALPVGVSSIAALMDVINEAEEPFDLAGDITMDSAFLGQPHQTLSAAFQSYTSQLQNWPSTSDLNASHGGSMYSGSNMSSHEEGDETDGLNIGTDDPLNSTGGGVGAEDIARWRSDLDSDADFRELLEGNNYPSTSRLPPPTDSSSRSSISSSDFDFAANFDYTNTNTNNNATAPPGISVYQKQRQQQQQQLVDCRESVGLFDPNLISGLDNHPSRFNPLASIYSHGSYQEQYLTSGNDAVGRGGRSVGRYGGRGGGRSDDSGSILGSESDLQLKALNNLSLDPLQYEPPQFAEFTSFNLNSAISSSETSSSVGPLSPSNGIHFDESGAGVMKQNRSDAEQEKDEIHQIRLGRSSTGVPLDRFKTERPSNLSSSSIDSSGGERKTGSDPSLSLERVKTERPSVFTSKGFFQKILGKGDVKTR